MFCFLDELYVRVNALDVRQKKAQRIRYQTSSFALQVQIQLQLYRVQLFELSVGGRVIIFQRSRVHRWRFFGRRDSSERDVTSYLACSVSAAHRIEYIKLSLLSISFVL